MPLDMDVIAQNFSRLKSLQRGPTERPDNAVQENHRDESITCTGCNVAVCLGSNRIDGNVHKAGDKRSPEVQIPLTLHDTDSIEWEP
jgi:hypothetical protein